MLNSISGKSPSAKRIFRIYANSTLLHYEKEQKRKYEIEAFSPAHFQEHTRSNADCMVSHSA